MLHIRIAAMHCFIADVIRTYDWLISNINDNNKRHVLFFTSKTDILFHRSALHLVQI